MNKKISEVIRERIVSSGGSYFSNDNISSFIDENERKQLVTEVEKNIEKVLDSLIIDVKNDHNTQDTAHRIAKMYINEIFRGRYYPKPKITSFPNAKIYDQLYVTGPITVRSSCAHHFENIRGKAYIGIFPGSTIIGLSKFNRIVDWFASRPTIQEELTIQIADEIEKITGASGLAVVIKASHSCLTERGVREAESDFTTSVLRGQLKANPSLKDEFFKILGGMK